jgi:RNA ligase (TIGR02306 family)
MYKDGNRIMAWVTRIDHVERHPNADALDICTVGGWKCVTKLGEFKTGDLAVYCSIDSWIPHELAPFLSKGQEPRVYNGVRGERLRTVKLRGTVSQGLLIPAMGTFAVGTDMTQALGIQKWEAPIPAQLAGDIAGPFPTFVPKTDQERIQNLITEFESWKTNQLAFEVTEKLDGSSMTVFFNDGDFGVCSRNWSLKQSENNSFWVQAHKYNLRDILTKAGNFAIQGELIGEGIQGNPYKIRGQDFYVYDVYDIINQCYLNAQERQQFVERNNLKHVPVIAHSANLSETLKLHTVDYALTFAEGASMLNPNTEREGLVFKCAGQFSFKAISNKFLWKNGK